MAKTAKKSANGKAPAKKAAAKPSAAKKTASAPRALGQGAPTLIKQMVLKNPKITNTELQEKLKSKGVKVSPAAVSTIRSQFRHSIRILSDAGHCKPIDA